MKADDDIISKIQVHYSAELSPRLVADLVRMTLTEYREWETKKKRPTLQAFDDGKKTREYAEDLFDMLYGITMERGFKVGLDRFALFALLKHIVESHPGIKYTNFGANE